MKNLLYIACGTFLLMSCHNNAQNKTKPAGETATPQMSSTVGTKSNTMKEATIYQFTAEDLYGNTFDFAKLKGQKIMIVNTASKCGLTPQYKQLEELYEKYKDDNFIIVGFPANNFAGQEPGTNAEIGEFCQRNYGVTFPMMAKISVKGDDMAKIYQFLTQKSKNGLQDSEVQWNFQKYLIDENGKLVKVISPETLPNDSSIVSWIRS